MSSRIKAIAASRYIFDYVEAHPDTREFLSADVTLQVFDRIRGLDLGDVFHGAVIAGLRPDDWDKSGVPTRWVRK